MTLQDLSAKYGIYADISAASHPQSQSVEHLARRLMDYDIDNLILVQVRRILEERGVRSDVATAAIRRVVRDGGFEK